MTDVLLTHVNHLFHDAKQVAKMQPYPPLQTLLAAAVLREAGVSVEFLDTTFDAPEPAFRAALEDCSPRLVVVCEDDFNFLTKMCLSRNRELAFQMARLAREYGIPAAVHGSDSSDRAASYLDAGFQYVLIGEVESTVLELAAGTLPAEIAGLAFRENRTVRYTQPRHVRSDLDALPLPARDLADINRYREAWIGSHGYFSLNAVSSRGCPYRCNWCSKPIWGDRYHVRSAQSVAAEMLQLKRQYQPDHVWFADDIFAMPEWWSRQFAAALASLAAVIPFKMQSRCDLMTRDSVRALSRAGCVEAWMGVESGSQRVLDAMDKGLRVEAVYQARENLRRHGIRACYFLQFGYPGEGWAEIEETIRLVRETGPDDIGVSVAYPLPGTRFHQLVSADLGVKSNWSDSGDLAMMFRGTYSTEFYRALADALHLEVRQPNETAAIRTAWELVTELRGSQEAVRIAS